MATLSVVIGLGTLSCGGTTRSTSRGPIVAPEDATSAEASYNAGLQHFQREEYALAAEAFDRAIAANPNHAYAYYYAGRAYSEQQQTVLMADRFEMFVKLAPNAPERPAVESILRTTRG
jgi:Tfp pilus assembly protein PilF